MVIYFYILIFFFQSWEGMSETFPPTRYNDMLVNKLQMRGLNEILKSDLLKYTMKNWNKDDRIIVTGNFLSNIYILY